MCKKTSKKLKQILGVLRKMGISPFYSPHRKLKTEVTGKIRKIHIFLRTMSSHENLILEDATFHCGCGVSVDCWDEMYDHGDEWHRCGTDNRIHWPAGTHVSVQGMVVDTSNLSPTVPIR